MPSSTLIFLTDFADQAVILPVVGMVAIVLGAQRRWRVAAAWLLTICGVLGGVLVLKVLCFACGWLVPEFGPEQLALRSPSGHAASAAVAYGGVAALLAPRMRLGRVPAASLAALVAAAGMAALIGLTRVQLGAHSLSEVFVAAFIGLTGAVVFTRLAGQQISRRSGLPVLLGVALVLLLFHGRHLPAEAIIQNSAAEALRRWVVACQPERGRATLAFSAVLSPTAPKFPNDFNPAL